MVAKILKILNSVIENNDNYIVESDNEQHIYETDLAYLCGILDKVFWIYLKLYVIFINNNFYYILRLRNY